MNRREFLNLSVCSAGASLAGCASSRSVAAWTGTDKVKALLLHLGHNMWCEWLPDELMKTAKFAPRYVPDLVLRNKTELWNKVTNYAAERKLNMIVIDIGEGLVYPSHPELAIEGSWTADQMRDEVIRLRKLGLEAIPKLNFSATHDGWLKHYHRMLTLPEYYAVVKDIVRDVAEIFQTPRFFHLGYDEETASYSKDRNYFVMRTGDMWWHDFLYTIRCVEDCGCRPWVWSDYGWHHEDYFTRCPKSVVQSDWYYDECNANFSLDPKKNGHWFRLQEIHTLEKECFDQIPCGTNWVGGGRRRAGVNADDVIGKLVKYGREHISDKHLLGFMMAPWASCDKEENVRKNIRGIDLFAEALG